MGDRRGSGAAIKPYVERLEEELATIQAMLDDFLGRSNVAFYDPNAGRSSLVSFVGMSRWFWQPSDDQLTSDRMRLLGRFQEWIARLRLLFPNPTPEVTGPVGEAEDLLPWLERPDNHRDVPSSIPAALDRAAGVFVALERLLALASIDADSATRLVPDTNALIDNPDLASYASVANGARHEVVLLPQVMHELDELKVRGRTDDLREKAQSVQRRVKGLRDKGSLSEGVRVTKGMTVRTVTGDVDPPMVLSWLTRESADDRILAGALALQSRHPRSIVVLVTGDLNLQSKADAAGLPYVETPKRVVVLAARLEPELGYRRSWEVPGGAAQVRLTNNGTASAEGVKLRVVMGSPGGPSITAGEWDLGTIEVGNSVTHDTMPIVAGEVEIEATWTDPSGQCRKTWGRSFPDRPPLLTRR
jgi:rRNA maturation endonuclease Nob1